MSVAYPLMPVTAGSGGGAEHILRIIERSLFEAGFQSTVIAAAGSQVSGTLIETLAASGTISDEIRSRAQKRHRELLEAIVREQAIDIIHYHGLDFLNYRPPSTQVPELATLHLPLDWYPANLFGTEHVHFNFVSKSQAKTSRGVAQVPVIPNGVELTKYRVASEKGDYLLWLGRICPEKGTAIALRIAHNLGVPLLVAGPVHEFTSHRTYFEEQVRPQLDTTRTYVGTLNAEQKAELLSRAKCLLVPSLAPETSSLVAMEAISSGTPVIAFRSGALPEIVEHGITGFLVDSEEQMAAAVGHVHDLSPAVMRARAETRFSSESMVAAYFQLYDELVRIRR